MYCPGNLEGGQLGNLGLRGQEAKALHLGTGPREPVAGALQAGAGQTI